MKDYIKPTIEILEQRIEKSVKETGSSEIDSAYDLGLIHTLSQNHISSTGDS